MRGISALIDCFSSPFSAVIKFQKQFVDDVIINVKKQSEVLNRHNLELHNREVRLHLDHLEEEFLCCVCGKPGEERDTEDIVPDEFRIIHMPSKEVIEKAIIASSRSIDGRVNLDDDNVQALGPQVYALLAVLSASNERDTRKMLAKVQHAILNQEAAAKQKHKKSSHRDKGLMKIEESDIDMFQQFFRRPVHGYLCLDCYTSAKKRFDALTNQIQSILFKGKNPFIRSSSSSSSSSNNNNINKIPVQDSVIPTSLFPVNSSQLHYSRDERNFIYLSDSTILYLRSNVRCAVCKRRQSCFFVRQSVTFLCQFCCARDRFYRDNAICINDELMPRETAHLLESLASRYTEIKGNTVENTEYTNDSVRYVDLFPEHNSVDLFTAQLPPNTSINTKPAIPRLPSSLDRRSVAGNTSVSLFSGIKFEWNFVES